MAEFDVEFLIALVERRPVLWDKNSNDYRDRIKTRNAWRQICEEMRPDLVGKEQKNLTKAVQQKWANIRDSFVKWKKKEKEAKRSGAGASQVKKYVFANQLGFLVGSLRTNRKTADTHFMKNEREHDTSDSLTADTAEEQKQEIRLFDQITSKDRANVTEQEVEARKTAVAEKYKSITDSRRKKVNVDPMASRILDVLEQREKPTAEAKPLNRHISFMQGLLPTLNMFSDDEVIAFQSGVLKLIMDIKAQRMPAV